MQCEVSKGVGQESPYQATADWGYFIPVSCVLWNRKLSLSGLSKIMSIPTLSKWCSDV